jgi:hypothetical protein
MTIIRPYLENAVLGQEQDWKELLRTSVKDMALRAATIPESVQELLGRTNRGELEIRVPELIDASRILYAAAHQLIYCIFGVAAGVVAYEAYDRGRATVAGWLAVASGLCLVGLVISIAGARRPRR